MRVSVHLVTYNSMPDILEALSSLERQVFSDFRVLVVDNASSDETVALIQERYGNRVGVLRNYQNVGFALAHNQAIELSKRGGVEFVVVMNPDAVLESSTLSELVACADRHPNAGAVAARLLRPDALTLDSTGMRCRKSLHVFERGSGKPAEGNYLREEEVFGACGALSLYRMRALEAAALSGEYFDNDFFAYKEDVDLSWRLRLLGYDVWYAPKAVARHARQIKGAADEGFTAFQRNRAARSSSVSRWSYRNHWWMLLKNLRFALALKNAPWWLARELFAAGYLLLFEFPTLLTGIREALVGVPRMLRKRHAIMASSTVSVRDMGRWFQ